VALAGTYFLASWYMGAEQQRQAEAKKLFSVQSGDITLLVLKKGPEEIRLAKEGNDWRLTKPLAQPADPLTVNSLLGALTALQQTRELAEEKDLARFGLDKPAFILEFTAKGAVHRLVFGSRTPGDQGFYVLKDQAPQVLIVAAAAKETLDRPLKDLREKTLLEFSPDQVKGLALRLGGVNLELKRTKPGVWQWEGRETLKIRTDRVESLLRTLQLARAQDFVDEAPKDLKAYGLAPKPAGEVVVTLEKGPQTLLLGARQGKSTFARRGSAGPVVLVEQTLADRLEKAAATLEDRRLWSGDIVQVAKISWGPPGQLFQARKEKDVWQITGPGKENLKQPAARLEAALITFQRLEYVKLLPGAPAPEKPAFVLELADAAGKVLLRLEETSRPDKDRVEARLTQDGRTGGALIPARSFEQWQLLMQQLGAPAK
jgi:hypothetical protein